MDKTMKVTKTKAGAAISTGFGMVCAVRRIRRGRTTWVAGLQGALALVIDDTLEAVVARVSVPAGLCAFVAGVRATSSTF